MPQATYSGVPKELSKMIARKHREDYRRDHGTNPPSAKETIVSIKTHLESMTPKDHAALAVRLAEADVAHFKMFSRTPMERIEADNNFKEAQRKYREASGQETPRTLSLREKVCELLKNDSTKVWTVRELATTLNHPVEHVGVVASFLRKDKNKKWNVT